MTPRSLAAAALLFAVLLMASGCSTNPSFSSITQFGFLNPIAVPNSSTTTPFTSFDITFVDQGSQRMIVSSRSTKQVALFDASKDTALGATAAVFAGVGVDNPHSGPNGAVIVGNQIWAGDAASIVRVFDMSTNTATPPQIATINTGGTLRADEMDYDPTDKILAVVNDADDVPFVTLISTTSRTILTKVFFDGSNGTVDATQGGLGAALYNSNTGRFLISVVQIGSDSTKGAVAEMNPTTGAITHIFRGIDMCQPSGLAQGPSGNVLVGCDPGAPAPDAPVFSPRTYVINGATGAIVATITEVGGEDEVWYNSGDNRYYTASRDFFTDPNATSATPVLGVIDAGSNKWIENIDTSNNAHSVAANSHNNHIYVPQRSGAAACGTLPGCVSVYVVH